MDPIVAKDRVFVATHQGNLYALNAKDGEPLWKFQAHGPFLHSPAVADGILVAANGDGYLHGIDTASGELKWSLYAGPGGFSASPTISDQTAFIGSRSGEFWAVDVKSGKRRWQQPLSAPVRQTAAFSHGSVFVTSENLRVHCLDAETGRQVWVSEQLTGQTARDYYPVVATTEARTFVIVRTNPVLGMANHIGRDRHFLCQNAGVDDSGWKKVDAWIKSPVARGNPELWAKEQGSITHYLQEHREARTCFVLDAENGSEALTAPVLWIAGCQAVGAMPALAQDGRLLVFYRSAYGNWNHGVAPLVALGLLDLSNNRIAPLEHQHGRQPAWNTFWGTADESQNFTVVGDTVLIVHQGTLSGFHLKTNKLFPIYGERDTFGGFRTPPWARNEWHGPGRGGIAVDNNRIYWLTGSRLLCLAIGEQGPGAIDQGIDGTTVPTRIGPKPPIPSIDAIAERLNGQIREVLSKRWAPLYVEPGLAGRDFSFDNSADVSEALAWVYPHLEPGLQATVKTFLAKEWMIHAPWSKNAWYPLNDGERRELFWTPETVRSRLSLDKPHHPFANTYAVWLCAERCGEWERVLEAWPQIKSAFEDFAKSSWRLDSAKGDLHANRYLASLLAFARIAKRCNDSAASQAAESIATETSEALAAWWKRAAEQGTLTAFKGVSELDPFIGKGDAFSMRVSPHRHKIALFRDLTPEVADLVKQRAPDAVERVWSTFETLCVTWPFVGEERQIHFGENFVDPPDLAMSAFRAMAWLRMAPAQELFQRVDLPFGRADLSHATKLALALERR
ncbi:MAG: PQQ-like beta-propeller repeat protein [Verrucomicrobia bacterium]|nr:PQQ-like beta-propeller repeat protein [Verrucomicrobiota bacterium]